jgi:hypothetical protein
MQVFDWSVDLNNPINYGRIATLVPLTPLPEGEVMAVSILREFRSASVDAAVNSQAPARAPVNSLKYHNSRTDER